MPKTYGRVEYGTKSKKWRAIGYTKVGETKLGEYDTRDEAVVTLRRYVTDRSNYGHGSKSK
jgi:hypothetical protein